jgi:hypothetical protein
MSSASAEEMPVEETEQTIIAEVISITPEMAKAALDNRLRNRPLKQKAVARYAHDMREGKWRLNGETVSFSNGRLSDGQNRMQAVVNSGQTIEFLVVNGINPDAIITMNTGVSRRFSDYLVIGFGMKNATLLGTLTTRMYRWDVQESRMMGHSRSIQQAFSYQDLADYFKEHQAELESAAESGDRKVVRTMMPASLHAMLTLVLRRIDHVEADNFMHKLITGAGFDNEQDMILVLRNRLMTDRNSVAWRTNQGDENDVITALVFKTWNMTRDKEVRSKLQLPRGGLTEKNFPVPH